MANLGAQTLIPIHVDPTARVHVYNTAQIACNNSTYNAFSVDLLEDFSQAWLARLMIATNNAATPPVYDQNIETARLQLSRKGVLIAQMVPADRAIITGSSSAVTVADQCLWQWHVPFNFPVRPNDTITFILPPPDDDASPTGDYTLNQLELTSVQY